MKNLFKLFMKTEGITVKQLAEYGEQALSMRFNEWVKDLSIINLLASFEMFLFLRL